ncbi:unnamed protein product [Pseudo-nitzschia multistriata]|uniref:Uncharacterized protein n=1 Tax=Pseudo-nitzschia multistriata TaxID=183589 RepID=A0A448Z439_9STRA|nr:unnamed protein product [Pseudo-nitzschia multistriata]
MTDPRDESNDGTSSGTGDDDEEQQRQQRGRKPPSTPSFLSPVGTTSRNYSVALDEDEIMDLSSPLTPTMGIHPPLHAASIPPSPASRGNNGRSHRNANGVDPGPNSPERRSVNHRFWESDYEADYRNGNNHASDDEDDSSLPVPLLGYDYHHDDSHYRRPSNSHQQRRHHRLNHDQHYHSHRQNRNAPPKLNGLNYLNVITYVLNVFTSYFIGVQGLFGVMPKRRDIFLEYETLVTPADYAYYLWAPILVFEFFFATAQLFPHYRARPIIQQGTGLYFFWACIIQTVWTVFFAMRWFILSFVAVVLALLCLVFLLASQHYNCLCVPTVHRGGGGIMTVVGFLSSATGVPRQRRKSLLEYWLFRFPFYLHCGWLLVCTVVQLSMAFRYRFTDSTGGQLAADIVALGVLLPPGTFFLTGQSSGPDFVIPLVIVWSYISIAVELHTPSETLIELYGHPAIVAVRNASYVFTGLIGVMLVPRIVVWIAQEFCTIDVVELVDDDGEEDYISTTMNEVRNGGGAEREGGFFHGVSLRIDNVAGEESASPPSTHHPAVGGFADGSDDSDEREDLPPLCTRRRNEEYVLDDEESGEEDFQDCREIDHDGAGASAGGKHGEETPTETTEEDVVEE